MAESPEPYPAYRPSEVLGLGDIPEHWRVRKVRDEAQIVNGYPFDANRFSPTDGHPLIRIRDLNKAHTATRYDGPFVEAARVEPGDVLIGMDGDFNVGIWAGSEPALLNQRMCCVRGRLPLTTQLLRYALPGPLREINEVTWSTTVKHLSSGQVERIAFACPPPAEQAAIVRFLDHADRRIRRYIAGKKKLIALLNEQKQAVIHRAVTRGLDPDVSLKPSGVEWLGDVPEHWEVVRTRYVLREVDNRSAAGEETHLSMSQKLGLVPSSMLEQHTLVSESYAGGKLCEAGDLVLNRLKAHLGVFALAAQSGVISPDYTVMRQIHPLSMRYCELIFRSPAFRGELRIRAKGIVEGFWRLYTDDFYDIRIPLPPLREQEQIVTEVESESANGERAARRAEREISLLREYRTRMIADVVTGKLDVREAAALLADEVEAPEQLDDAEDIMGVDESEAGANLDAALEVGVT